MADHNHDVPDDNLQEQRNKPVVESASPGKEDAAAQAGQVRPADPKDADDVLDHRVGANNTQRDAADAAVLGASRKRTRRTFVGLAAGAAAAYGFRRYLEDGPSVQMIPGLLHGNYAWNADVSRDALPHSLAPTLPAQPSRNAAHQWHLRIEKGVAAGQLPAAGRRRARCAQIALLRA